MSQVKSQKLAGLMALIGGGYHCINLKHYGSLAKLQSELDTDNVGWFLPAFARPCPVRPRHGFVESRVINTTEELQSLVEEVKVADPDGEIMFTEYYRSIYNAIWTPSMLAIGKGHDGATAGKNVKVIPLAGVHSLNQFLLAQARIGKEEDPYIEIIWPEYEPQCRLTQLRAGPKVESLRGNYIPNTVEVKEVIRPNGMDLLKWESLIQAAPPGTVIYHPGGAVTDHYFVHARVCKVPVMTSREPVVGEVLIPSVTEPSIDPRVVLRGVVLGEEISLDAGDFPQAVALLLIALHNAAVMTEEHSKWLGVAVSLVCRLGSMALRGESRHRRRKAGIAPKVYRDYIYTRHRNRSLSFHAASLSRLVNTFRYGDWASGFGGTAWAKCGVSVSRLMEKLKDFAINPSAETTQRLVMALNVAINQAHNGGWWFNKFAEASMADMIQLGNLPYLLKPVPLIMRIFELNDTISEERVEKARVQYTRMDPTVRTPVDLCADYIYLPHSGYIELKLSSRLLSEPLVRHIPITGWKDKLPLALSGKLALDTRKMKLILEGEDGSSIPVWEEEELLPKGVKNDAVAANG